MVLEAKLFRKRRSIIRYEYCVYVRKTMYNRLRPQKIWYLPQCSIDLWSVSQTGQFSFVPPPLTLTNRCSNYIGHVFWRYANVLKNTTWLNLGIQGFQRHKILESATACLGVTRDFVFSITVAPSSGQLGEPRSRCRWCEFYHPSEFQVSTTYSLVCAISLTGNRSSVAILTITIRFQLEPNSIIE